MKTTILKPILYNDLWHKDFAVYLMHMINDIIFSPLLDIADNKKENAKYTLLEAALKSGAIKYSEGIFSGKVNAKISKEIKAIGGRFILGHWHLPTINLPPQIHGIIKRKKTNDAILFKNIEVKLEKIASKLPYIIETFDLKKYGHTALNITSKKFKNTVRQVLAVKPELDKLGKEKIKQDYLMSTDLPIRKKLLHEFEDRSKAVIENFSQETVEKLRKALRVKILNGESRESIQEYIRNRLKISNKRAKFIARQETALMTSKFKQAQYEQWGIRKYKWVSLEDHIVRPIHAENDGKIFEWSKPPIIAINPERHGHPGEDFNCRCIAQPVVEW